MRGLLEAAGCEPGVGPGAENGVEHILGEAGGERCNFLSNADVRIKYRALELTLPPMGEEMIDGERSRKRVNPI